MSEVSNFSPYRRSYYYQCDISYLPLSPPQTCNAGRTERDDTETAGGGAVVQAAATVDGSRGEEEDHDTGGRGKTE